MKSQNKNLVAYIISDLHLNDYAKHSTRLDTGLKILKDLFLKARENDIQYIIHCGDLLHDPSSISINLLDKVISSFREFFHITDYKVDFLSISGNHEIYDVSKIGQKPKSWNSILGKIFDNNHYINLDYIQQNIVSPNLEYMTVFGVPYVDHNEGLTKYLKEILDKYKERQQKKILLLHTDYPGAKDTDGRIINSSENLNLNILGKFDLVICGHIHKSQRLSKKVYMVGAPYQQRRTDKDCDMGYWELYDDLRVKFVPILNTPRFIDVKSSEEVKDDGHYYTVLPESKDTSNKDKPTISKHMSKYDIAKAYMRAKGIKDSSKKKLLVNILKESEKLC